MNTRFDEANKVTMLSILWNVILTIIKIFAGILGRSSSMIADAMHSA